MSIRDLTTGTTIGPHKFKWDVIWRTVNSFFPHRPDLAEEAANDAGFKLSKIPTSYKLKKASEALTIRISRNAANDVLNRDYQQRGKGRDTALGDRDIADQRGRGDQGWRAILNDFIERIHTRLSKRDQQVFCKTLEGMGVSEIKKALNVRSRTTIYKSLARIDVVMKKLNHKSKEGGGGSRASPKGSRSRASPARASPWSNCERQNTNNNAFIRRETDEPYRTDRRSMSADAALKPSCELFRRLLLALPAFQEALPDSEECDDLGWSPLRGFRDLRDIREFLDKLENARERPECDPN